MSKSFMARLEDIGIDITTDNPLNLRLQHLIYFEQFENKLYRKFMEDPHVLFYRHKGHTYQHNYDGSILNAGSKLIDGTLIPKENLKNISLRLIRL